MEEISVTHSNRIPNNLLYRLSFNTSEPTVTISAMNKPIRWRIWLALAAFLLVTTVPRLNFVNKIQTLQSVETLTIVLKTATKNTRAELFPL